MRKELILPSFGVGCIACYTTKSKGYYIINAKVFFWGKYDSLNCPYYIAKYN